jgi:hypothetical protein
MDEVDYITITRAAMYSKGSAVKASECDSAAKIIKRSILNQKLYQQSQNSALRHGQKRSTKRPALAEIFGLGLENNKVNVF